MRSNCEKRPKARTQKRKKLSCPKERGGLEHHYVGQGDLYSSKPEEKKKKVKKEKVLEGLSPQQEW